MWISSWAGWQWFIPLQLSRTNAKAACTNPTILRRCSVFAFPTLRWGDRGRIILADEICVQKMVEDPQSLQQYQVLSQCLLVCSVDIRDFDNHATKCYSCKVFLSYLPFKSAGTPTETQAFNPMVSSWWVLRPLCHKGSGRFSNFPQIGRVMPETF